MPIDQLKSIFTEPRPSEQQASETINSMDHFELARLLHQLNKDEKVIIFQYLTDDIKRQELLYETDQESRIEIGEALGSNFMAPFLEGMPKDEAADILLEHEPEVQEEILEQMVPDQAQTLKNLIRYEEQTAGGMMTPHYNRIDPEDIASEILTQMIRNPSKDSVTDFYVVGNDDKLLGYFTLRDLLNVLPNSKALNIVRKETPKVLLDETCEKIANLMDHEFLSTVPVVDDHNIIHGVVTFDDVFRGLKNTANDEIYTMVGAPETDPFARKTRHKVAARAPWLFTTFIGGMISAVVLKSFQVSLPELTAVIFFIPFVLGLAGNVGIQGATIIVRGLATGDIQNDNLKTVLKSEIKVGLSNGLIFGTICGFTIMLIAESLLNTSPALGLTVGLGIVLAVAMATIIGSFTPLLFLKLKIDPAISTGPVVTVVNDIIGLIIYLYTATRVF
ncbi:MAG: magnesium transporter, partial [Nitrospinota bacterium]|nr:magnesium transporter [Nitrospinota bacterium]